MSEIWTIKRALDWCCAYLEAHKDAHPRQSAQWLISDACHLTRIELYMYYDRPLSSQERAKLRASLKRRGHGEPLQYITGKAAFRRLVLDVEPSVFIPRPETEVLVDVALELIAQKSSVDSAVSSAFQVLEIGCGTACIAASLAQEASCKVLACDISAKSCQCARRNIDKLGLSELVSVEQCDLASGITAPPAGFDMLVSNPPYIPTAVYASLDAEVRKYEPQNALDGGKDGLAFFDRLLTCVSLLKAGGFFVVELYEDSLDTAAARGRHAGLCAVEIHKDLAGRPRILSACV